jgi:hypothetical protein
LAPFITIARFRVHVKKLQQKVSQNVGHRRLSRLAMVNERRGRSVKSQSS